jgi:uncharacterized LabA/DUF88 family protein
LGRVTCLIDGFNLYHAIDRTGDESLKWCNYWDLAQRFVKPQDTLTSVCYFTALAYWKPEGMSRHTKLIDAQKANGVDVILGEFKRVKRHCKRCQSKYSAHEEKRTDVNLATYLVHLAHIDAFDTVLIISSDSDYTSAIELVRESFPHKAIGIIFPVGQKKSDELASKTTFIRYMKAKDLKRSLLPKEIELPDGSILTRPVRYD